MHLWLSSGGRYAKSSVYSRSGAAFALPVRTTSSPSITNTNLHVSRRRTV